MHALSIVFTAFVGAAAASTTGAWQGYNTTTTPTPSASETVKSSLTPSASVTTSGSIIPSTTANSTGIITSSGTIIPSHTANSTNIITSSGIIIPSQTANSTGIITSSGTIIPSNTANSTGIITPSGSSTQTLTTFTTVTTCPVTQTKTDHGSTYITTTLTTSTVVVTSCKAGCHGWVPTSIPAPDSTYVQPTDKPTTLPTDKPTTAPTNKPTTSEYAPGTTSVITTKVYPTTIIETITSFVPCSTSVSHEGSKTVYSTWLTATHVPHTIVSTISTVKTLYPAPTSDAPKPTNGGSDACEPTATVTVTVVYENGGYTPIETGEPTTRQGPNPTTKPHWTITDGASTITTDKPASPTGTGSPSAGSAKRW